MTARVAAPVTRCGAALLVTAWSCLDPPVATRATGTINVSVSMTGAELPPTYTVVIAGQARQERKDVVAVVSGITAGDHAVQLSVAPTCQVDGPNPRSVTVIAGQITNVTFSVSCAAMTGTLRLTTITTGVDVDLNGYTARVEGFSSVGGSFQRIDSVPTTGTSTLSFVPGGNQRATLAGLAVNCDVVGENPRPVLVPVAETVSVTFNVTCVAANNQLAYIGDASNGAPDIFVANANGTGVRRLAVDLSSDEDPAWSPNGKKIAFTSDRDHNREIYVIDADGSNAVRLTNSPAADFRPTWSPDGGRIAFVSERSGNAEIWVMQADGTNATQLTNNAAFDLDPAWSPDGRSIAFTSTRDGKSEVYIMDASGSEPTRFTSEGGRHPAWSPDGAHLAYSAPFCPGYPYGCYTTVFVKPRSGPAERLPYGPAERPAWSPDGRKIVYNSFLCDYYLIKCNPTGFSIVRVDGTDIIGGGAVGRNAVWRP